jgi:hypothetical protein
MIPEKQKAFVYYRCQAPSCRGNSIREDALDAAIQTTLAGTPLAEEHLAAIDREIGHWRQRSQGGDIRKTLAMKLQNIDDRIHKLEDAAIDRIIDAESFSQRKERLLIERAKLLEQSRKTANSDKDARMLRSFLERLKSLAEHYEFAEGREKREIIKITTSNRLVGDKNVSVEPAYWLQTTQKSLGVFSCAESRTTSRTRHDVSNLNIDELLEIADHQNVAKLLDIPTPVGSAKDVTNPGL